MSDKSDIVGPPTSETKKYNNEELRKIAWDVHSGKIFTDWHIRKIDINLASTIFMPLIFMSKEQIDELADAGMIYEYRDKSLPRCINGYPMFMSCCVLNKEDADKVRKFIDKIEWMKREFETYDGDSEEIIKEDDSL